MHHPDYKRVKPGEKTPDLMVDTLASDGQAFDVSESPAENFTLLVVYRGLHCPKCKAYLQSLEKNLDAFEKRGVNVVAVSMDSKDRAEQARKEWGLKKLLIGYELSEPMAQQWGLFLSDKIEDSKEPELFAEPALFLIRPDQSLYSAVIQSTPFARPRIEDVMEEIDYVLENDYPARGTHTEKKAA